jgi:hypothetical protein
MTRPNPYPDDDKSLPRKPTQKPRRAQVYLPEMRPAPGGWMVCSVRRDSHRLFERCHAMLRSLRLQRRRLESLCRLTRLRCQQTSRQLARCEDCPFSSGCPTPAALDALRAQVNQELGDYS